MEGKRKSRKLGNIFSTECYTDSFPGVPNYCFPDIRPLPGYCTVTENYLVI